MANYFAKFADIRKKGQFVPQGYNGGHLRIFSDIIDVGVISPSAALAAGDVIELCKIPAGLKLVDVIVQSESMGTTGAIKIGTVADDACLGADIDVSASAKVAKLGASANFLEKLPAEENSIVGDINLIATVTTAFTAVTGKIKISVIGFFE